VRPLARLWSGLLAPTHPINLAVFRITVFAVMLASKDIYEAARIANLPPELRAPPPGLAWLATHVPIDGAIARAALALLIASSCSALVGYRARTSALLATGSALYLLGVPQLYGTVRHYHHLVWFAALLAASPCGDALSIDRWLLTRRHRAPSLAPSPAYGLPIRTAWILIGFIYFFPGAWKLASSGWAWAWSDNLINQMHWKWLQYGGWTPAFRIDRHPLLCRLAATATIMFELSFPFLVFVRRLRAPAVVAAIAFHVATAVFMRISFAPLWLCYTVFFDWAALGRSAEVGAPPRITRASAAMSAVLLLGNAYCGARGLVERWPFACYPTFQWMAPAEMPAIELETFDADGRLLARIVGAASPHVDSQRLWGLQWSLASRPPGRERDAALRAYWELLAPKGTAARAVAQVRCYRGTRPVDPDHARDELERKELLCTFVP
jgi:hypothetical protein